MLTARCSAEAFSNARHLQPGAAFFPAVSISHGEQCELNFGGRPLRYPVPGYSPIQDPPAAARQQAARYLLKALQRLVLLSVRSSSPDGAAAPLWAPGGAEVEMADGDMHAASLPPSSRQLFAPEDTVLLAAAIAQQLASLLQDPFLVSQHFIPFLQACPQSAPRTSSLAGRTPVSAMPSDPLRA